MVTRLLLFSLGLLLCAQETLAPLKRIDDLFRSKDYPALIEAARTLIITPGLTLGEKSKLSYYMGEAYAALNKPEEAIAQLLEVDRIDPTSPHRLGAYLRLKELHRQDLNRYQGYLEKIFTQFPKTPEAIAAGREWGSLLITSKTWSKAVEILETLNKLWKVEDPDGILHMQLATAHAGLRDFVEAVDYLQYVEARHKGLIRRHPDFMLTAAQILYSTQRFDQAASLLTRLINMFPTSSLIMDASLLLAQSHERLKNPYLGAVTLIQALKHRSPGTKRHNLMLLLGQLLSELSAEDRERLSQIYPGMTDSDQYLRQVYANAQEIDLKRQAHQILARDLRKRQLPEQAVDLYLSYLSKNRETAIISLLQSTVDEWLGLIASSRDKKSLQNLWGIFQNKKSFLSGQNLILLAQQLLLKDMNEPASEVLSHLLRYRMYKKLWNEAQLHQLELFRREKKYAEMQKILDTVQFQVSRKPVYRWYAWTVAKETKANEKIMDTLLSHLPPLELGDEKSRELAFAAIDRMIEKKAYPRADEELSKLLTRPDLLEADRPKITRRRALLAYHQGRLEEALGLYAELGKIAHEEAWALFRQISILRQLGRDQEAQSLTDQLRSRHPESYWSRQIR